ncbi:MAG: hypothetical protein ACRC28_17440 [Clostridium sp.]|uniref:hypothetical protein n=1 Tax=Clostridium sp. TaxID=1506 RepID=UPI003F3F4274
MKSEEFIEYGGISSFNKKNDKIFLIEFSERFILNSSITEITKINGGCGMEYFSKESLKTNFCVFKVNTTIECIKDLENFSLSIIEFENYFSSLFTFKKDHTKENFKVYIKNIKGKLLSNKEILIFYNLLVDFN